MNAGSDSASCPPALCRTLRCDSVERFPSFGRRSPNLAERSPQALPPHATAPIPVKVCEMRDFTEQSRRLYPLPFRSNGITLYCPPHHNLMRSE